jgi:hypothetical protein
MSERRVSELPPNSVRRVLRELVTEVRAVLRLDADRPNFCRHG